MIISQVVNTVFNSCSYVLSQDDASWIVDCGDVEQLLPLIGDHLAGVLLTHTHFDHIYGINNLLSRFPSCPVYVANAFGKEVLSDPKKNGSKYTEEGPIAINKDASIDIYPQEMELWEGVPLKVHYTPGHSDDSVCLQVEGMLFTGDTLIKDMRTVTKLKTGSREKLRESLDVLASLKGHGLMVYPGHEELFELDSYDLDNSWRMPAI